MQQIVNSQQLLCFAQSLLLGAFFGAFYDAVRFLRRFFTADKKGSLVFSNIFDIIYLTGAGCAFCVFLFLANNGRFRWFLLAGLAVGFALYRLTLGKLVIKVLIIFADALRKVFGGILKLALMPAKVIIKSVKSVFAKIKRKRIDKREKKEKEQSAKIAGCGRSIKGGSGNERKRNKLCN